MCPDHNPRQAPGGRGQLRGDLPAGRAGLRRDPVGGARPASGPGGLAGCRAHVPGRWHAPGCGLTACGRPAAGSPPTAGPRALIVGCGLGDDAEEAARRGYQVTAFDLSPTAIRDCRERFPGSAVDYQVADLFQLPVSWRLAFGLVAEIRTLQSLPLAQRADAARAIAATVRPGGWLFVHCLGRDDDERGDRPPVAGQPARAARSATRGCARPSSAIARPGRASHGRSRSAIRVPMMATQVA